MIPRRLYIAVLVRALQAEARIRVLEAERDYWKRLHVRAERRAA